MTRGLMKTSSRVALAAAAGLFATSAMAADLGGNCCADLEERVAELEATAARKGNRKVSLTVYGQVNESILYWDDGDKTGIYIGTNEQSRTRFGFRGEAQVNPDLTAGYLIEIGVRSTNSARWDQNSDDAGNGFDLRHSYWYLDSKSYGRISVGHQSTATDGITEINLANTGFFAYNDVKNWVGGFFLRPSGSAAGVAGQSALTWGGLMPTIANVGDGGRFNAVKYTTPTLAGFNFQVSAGEDEMWDVALRYAGEFNGVRIAAGIGYQQWSDADNGCASESSSVSGPRESTAGNNRDWIDPRPGDTKGGANNDSDCSTLGLSASVMHMPTGLFVSGSWGRLEDDGRRAAFARGRSVGYVINGGTPDGSGGAGGTIGILPAVDVGGNALAQIGDEDEHWYIQGGIERNWLGVGKTTLYGEYFKAESGGAVSGGNAVFLNDNDPLNPGTGGAGNVGVVASSNLEVWGFGVVQSLDAAAMDLYLGYRNYSGDATVLYRNAGGASDGAVTIGNGANREKMKLDDVHAVMGGAIIRF